MTHALGRTPADFVLDSYYRLFMKRREQFGLAGEQMVFRFRQLADGMIPALVLTAGLATRLRPLSWVRAKGALPVAGEPLVRRILRWLRANGVTDAVLNLHHLPHTLTARRRRRQRPGDARPLFVGEPRARLGRRAEAGAAAARAGELPEFLIVNGDTLTDLELGPMVDAPRRRERS